MPSFASIFQGLMLVRADKTARIAAEAANASAEVARNNLSAAERPWIKIKDIKNISPPEFSNDQARVDLEFTLKNVGHSPAIRTELQIKITISNAADLRIEQKNFADLIIATRDYAKANPSIVQTEFGFFPGQEVKFFGSTRKKVEVEGAWRPSNILWMHGILCFWRSENVTRFPA